MKCHEEDKLHNNGHFHWDNLIIGVADSRDGCSVVQGKQIIVFWDVTLSSPIDVCRRL
jgi:hypothetical protein